MATTKIQMARVALAQASDAAFAALTCNRILQRLRLMQCNGTGALGRGEGGGGRGVWVKPAELLQC